MGYATYAAFFLVLSGTPLMTATIDQKPREIENPSSTPRIEAIAENTQKGLPAIDTALIVLAALAIVGRFDSNRSNTTKPLSPSEKPAQERTPKHRTGQKRIESLSHSA